MGVSCVLAGARGCVRLAGRRIELLCRYWVRYRSIAGQRRDASEVGRSKVKQVGVRGFDREKGKGG